MAVLLFIAALALSTVASVAQGAEELIFSQVLHRHGSRSPIVPANQSVLCPSVGCGVLNANGIDMLTNLGVLLKERYGTQYFPTDNYDFNDVYTRSTFIPRTMQSAEALLRGAFNGTNYPVVYNYPPVDDKVLLSDSFPNLQFYLASINYEDAIGGLRKQLFPDDSTILAMAEEFSLQGYCASVGLTVCARKFYDPASCFAATGELANYPTVAANYPKLEQLQEAYFKVNYRYNKTLDATRGAPGQPTAQAMVDNFKASIAGNQPYKFIHYSAHDTTVTPLGVTLGDETDMIMLPGFGVMVLIDLVKEDGTYYVRGIKGTPQQTPGAHAYATEVLTLGGMDSNGAVTKAATLTDRIPFEDFVRFIDSSKPTAAGNKGLCSVPASQLEAEGCWVAGAPANSLCLLYRQVCPEWACPDGTALSFPNYGCVQSGNNNGPAGDSTFAPAATGLIAMGTTLGGIIIGAAVMLFIKKQQDKAKYESLHTENLNA